LPPQPLAPRPSLTNCDHTNAKHYAIEKYEERLTVGDKKIRVKLESEFRSGESEKSNPAANFAWNLQGFG